MFLGLVFCPETARVVRQLGSRRPEKLRSLGHQGAVVLTRGGVPLDSLVRSLRHMIYIPWALWK